MKKILTITTTPQKKNSKTSLNTSLVDQWNHLSCDVQWVYHRYILRYDILF
jgi:hypothetical protein